ncbi:von Willebrand factor C and EGF domain-containing protein, partial [Orchesella cincta]
PINRQVGISDNVYMTTQNGTDGFEQRVCSIDAVTYLDGETIPTSSPCEHCVCRPPGFACTITSCEYRPGCKAFRRSDQCCPEYQCECEKDGKIYQNGEKITDTNNPCEACYCQGGEIICAVIDCYWRNDCPPRYIDNRCCPMYDHCPPPSAQGPIRHRLPQLTSTLSPISWLNLTLPQSTSQAPSVETVATSASTTTTSTTTEAPSSTDATVVNDSENDIVSTDIVHHDEDVAVVPPVESLSVEPVQSNDVVETSSSAPVETTVGVEQELNDEPTEPLVALNDDGAEESDPTVEPTSVTENLVSSTVIDSTTLFIAPALVLTIAPTQVQETIVNTAPTAQPDFAAVDENRLSDDATTVASSDAEVSDDEPVATTNTPLIPEVQQDFASDSATTERLLDDDVATEIAPAVDTEEDEIPAVSDDANSQGESVTTETVPLSDDAIVNENPTTERFNDDISTDSPARSENDSEITTESPAQDEEALPATTLPPRSNIIQNPDELTRTDLQPEGFASGESVTNAAPVVYSDTSDGTTPAVILENELRNEDAFTTVSPSNIRNVEEDESNQVLNDVPATTSNILQDEQVTATPSSISLDDEHPINNDDIEDNMQIHDATVAPVYDDVTQVPQLDIQDDEASTQAVVHFNDEATQVPLLDEVANDDTTQPPNDDVNDVTQPPVLNDDVPVTQEPQQQDEGTDAPQHDSVIFSEDDATGSPQSNVLNDDVTQGPEGELNDEATVRSHAEEAPAELALEEKADVLSQDETITEVPVKAVQVQDGIDIILDDEVIPSEPEILNQVREVTDVHLHEPTAVEIGQPEAYKEHELYHGVRNADNDTVEIVNLSAAPIEQEALVPTTQQPLELNNDLEGEEVSQNDDVSSQLNVEATTVQNLDALSDDVPEVSTIVNDDLIQNDESVQGTTEGVLHEEGGIFNDEVQVTTEREFRSEILSDPHHEEGHVHEESERTTASPSTLERERSDLVVKDEEAAATAIYADEQTTSLPIYRNKVQKVAEALTAEVIAPESGANKFRLDPEVFKGSLEVTDSLVEATTYVPSKDLLRSGLGSLEIVEDAPQTTLRSLDDAPAAFRDGLAELTTQSPSNLRADLDELTTQSSANLRADLDDLTTQSPSNLRADFDLEVEVSTQKDVENHPANDDVTEGSGLQDELPTTPSARSGIHFDEVVERSGVTSSSLVLNDDIAEVTEGSGSAPRLDDEYTPTTSAPVAFDNAENEIVPVNEASASEPVTTSYAFRMDLLNSLEATDSNADIIENDVPKPTSIPQVAAVDDIANNPTEAAVRDEQVTTEAVSRLRSDLDITTEYTAPVSRDDVPEQSTVVSEILRADSDFVEVSTVSPSGFAAAFRDVRLAGEEIEVANDEPATSASSAQTYNDDETTPVVFADEPEVSTENPSEKLRTEAVEVEQQTEAIANDDTSAATTISSINNVNESDSASQLLNKVRKEGVSLPEMGVPKIQPISPDLSRSNPHELRFDFQLPPEKDSSWYSRAVNQFRRLSGFGSDVDSRDKSTSSVTTKFPSRRFLFF